MRTTGATVTGILGFIRDHLTETLGNPNTIKNWKRIGIPLENGPLAWSHLSPEPCAIIEKGPFETIMCKSNMVISLAI